VSCTGACRGPASTCLRCIPGWCGESGCAGVEALFGRERVLAALAACAKLEEMFEGSSRHNSASNACATQPHPTHTPTAHLANGRPPPHAPAPGAPGCPAWCTGSLSGGGRPAPSTPPPNRAWQVNEAGWGAVGVFSCTRLCWRWLD